MIKVMDLLHRKMHGYIFTILCIEFLNGREVHCFCNNDYGSFEGPRRLEELGKVTKAILKSYALFLRLLTWEEKSG